MKTEHNDLAYPVSIVSPDRMFELTYHLGLTKREYFAAMAMQGMLANSSNCNTEWNYETIGKHCALAADALIKALNEIQP
jgi:hypothetical protein